MSLFERLIPVLVYRDIPAAHDFLIQAFGFEPGNVERDDEGKAVHGEVRVGGTDQDRAATRADHHHVQIDSRRAGQGLAERRGHGHRPDTNGARKDHRTHYGADVGVGRRTRVLRGRTGR